MLLDLFPAEGSGRKIGTVQSEFSVNKCSANGDRAPWLKRIQRWLAARVAADVAGYSRLMGLDEVGTPCMVLRGAPIRHTLLAAATIAITFVFSQASGQTLRYANQGEGVISIYFCDGFRPPCRDSGSLMSGGETKWTK